MAITLIADGGSTKVEWIFISDGIVREKTFSTKGLNAAQTSENDLTGYFKSVKELLPLDLIPNAIHYYGAGCATPQICLRIDEALGKTWPGADIEVGSDMLGAARALLGNKQGVAAILGTGSNSALYDGEKIISNIPPLGFILGDEGSGTSLGKRLLGDIFKGLAPQDIIETFHEKYHLNLGEVIEKVYRKPGANAFIASFVPFINENISHKYMTDLVKDSFRTFFERNIAPYSLPETCPVNFTGSIAVVFNHLLKEVAFEKGYKTDRIIGKPILELAKYHISTC